MVASRGDKVQARWLFGCLLAYFSIHVLLRVILSDSLERDEAEQVLLSQWLSLGYTSQPPLYTWIQIIFFKIFGLSTLALAILKNALLFATYAFVYLSAKSLTKDTRLSVLAAASLLLIPPFSWGAQRDLTHTVLVVALSAATLYLTLRLLEARTTLLYALLGMSLGLGMLSKYNFFLFASGLFLSMLTTPSGRAVLFDRRILLSGLVVLLIDLPHLSWLFSNIKVASASADKFKMGSGNMLRGFGSMVKAVTLFLTPLWIFYLFFFREGFKPNPLVGSPVRSIFERYFFVLVGFMLVMVLFFKVSYFKVRWMQPLLFLFPVYFSLRLEPGRLNSTSYRHFLKVPIAAGVIIAALLPMRVAGGALINYYVDFNYPYRAIAQEIRKGGFSNGIILSDSGRVAGNLLLHFPRSAAFASSLKALDPTSKGGSRPSLVIWDAEESSELPYHLREWLKEKFGLDVEGKRLGYIKKRYKYSKDRYATVGTIIFHEPPR